MPTDLPMEIVKDIQVSLPFPDISPVEMPLTRGKLIVESVKAALTKTWGNKSKAARVLGVERAPPLPVPGPE